MNERQLRLAGLGIGAFIGFLLTPWVVLAVLLLTDSFRFRWPISHVIVLLCFTVAPIVGCAIAGAIAAPSIPRLRVLVQRAIRTDAGRLGGVGDQNTLTLRLSRKFTALYVPLGLVPTGASLFLVTVAGRSDVVAAVVGWVGLAIFGYTTMLFVLQVAFAHRFGMTLDRDGFTIRMNLGQRRYRWSEVERFSLFRTAAPYPVVVFKYRGKAKVSGIQMTRSLFGTFDGSLPQNLSIRGVPLLDLVEAWRARVTTGERTA